MAPKLDKHRLFFESQAATEGKKPERLDYRLEN
jgi:hypothetical protein